jgi:hypothetical protein
MMEASMHGSSDKQPREGQSAYRNWNMKLIALPILGVIALIALVVSHPEASKWISDAAQAEFVNMDFAPDLAPPTRIAQPNNEIRTVKDY